MIGAKPLCIRLDKTDGFIRVYDGTECVVLFGGKKVTTGLDICNRIRYLIGAKSSITLLISHNYSKIKFDSYDSLPLEKQWLFIKL